MSGFKSIRFYKLTFIILALVLAIVFLITAVTANVSGKRLKEESGRANSILVNKLGFELESRMYLLAQLAMQFSYNNLNGRDVENESQRIAENASQQIFENYDFIESIYIYYQKGRRVYPLFKDTVASNPEKTICDVDQFNDNWLYQMYLVKGYQLHLIGPRRPLAASAENLPLFSIVQGFPMLTPNSKNAVQFNIRADYLLGFAGDSLPQNGRLLILDEDEKRIISNGNNGPELTAADSQRIFSLLSDADAMPTIQLENDEDRYSCVIGNKTDTYRRYLLLIPEATLLQPVRTVLQSMIGISSVVLLLSLLIAVFIDKRYFQPALSLLRKLKSSGYTAPSRRRQNELLQISGCVDTILSERDNQERLLREYFHTTQQQTLLAILRGGAGSAETVEHPFPDPDASFFCLLLLKSFLPPETHDALSECLAGIPAEHSGTYLIPIRKGETAFLFFGNRQIDPQRLNQQAALLLPPDQAFFLLIGPCVESLQELSFTFQNGAQYLSAKTPESYPEIKLWDGLPLTEEKQPSEDARNRDLLEKVKAYIKAHYMEDIGLNTIAQYVFLSPAYLGRLFKEYTGVPFTSYLIEVRMSEAERMLLQTDRSVGEIAERTGYQSVQSFCRLFKARYHCTPGEYRKNSALEMLAQ